MTDWEASGAFDGSTVEGSTLQLEASVRSERIVATVLSHADLARIGQRAVLTELATGRPATISRLHPYFARPRAAGVAAAPLADRRLSREPLRLERREGGLAFHRDQQPQALAIDGRPLVDSLFVPDAALDLGVALEIGERVALLIHRVEAEAEPAPDFDLVGESDAVEALRRRIAEVGPTPWPVLIRGETGSGKELVAQALHRASRRRGPFLAVNLAALPVGLAAPELFGARRGAFTGATADRQGLFASALGGSLFLDEVGEASEELQTALLRTLETGEILPVGSSHPFRVDVRWLAATDARLEAKVESGDFRAALLHRLASLTLEVPPLRHRRDDVGRLLVHFLRCELAQLGKEPPWGVELEAPFLPPALLTRAVLHPWPGNVRELRNVARQWAVDWRGGSLAPDLLSNRALVGDEPSMAAAPTVRKLHELGRDEVAGALEASRYEIKAAAARLGVSRSSLYGLLERLGMKAGAGKLSDEQVSSAVAAAGGDAAVAARALGVSERALRRRLFEP